ncbi:uncharacterized protein LOC142488117 [Ascaphus truei]|uniref:uncharacterized protein LOC142488117 n=1 Tax=Ascaphus truei TaxID=8439 RepID=UPI003F5A48B9
MSKRCILALNPTKHSSKDVWIVKHLPVTSVMSIYNNGTVLVNTVQNCCGKPGKTHMGIGVHDEQEVLSCHPKSLTRGIPKGQLIRLKRICTNDDFLIQSLDLMRRFEARGYSKKDLNKAFDDLDEQISDLQGQLEPFKDSNELLLLEPTIIKKRLDQMELEIVQNKQRKFFRDKNDYDTGIERTWNKKSKENKTKKLENNKTVAKQDNINNWVKIVTHHKITHRVYIYVAPGGHVSPEMEQVSSPGSASSTLLEEHHGDEDDEYDEDDATEETEIQSCDHEEVPIETVVPPNRPSTSTYDAIVASEGKIVDAENRRHSDMMTVLERMIGLQEETVSQLAHLHRVFIEVPKQLQKINTSFEALVVQQTQANYWRMTNVPQFNTSQPGSVHAGQFSPHSSDIHSPGPNVTGQVAEIAVQVPDDILPLPSVQNQQLTPTKEPTKTKYKQLLLTSFWSKTTKDTHETDQPSLVQCLPTCSHVSLGTSPVREQSLPKSPVGESLPKSPVGESLPKSPVGESLPKSPVGESLPKSPVGESLPKSPVGESLPTSPVGESLATSPVGESLATSPVGESLATSPVGEQSLATSPAREVPEATQSGSVVPKVGGKRKRKIQETTSRPVTRSQKEQKK